MHFLIIGAGLSGLSAGVGLLRAGHRVTLLEKSDVVGGLARSFKRDGFIFDIGPHIFFGKMVVPMLQELLGSDANLLENNNLKRAIYFDERLFKYPFQPKDLLFKMDTRRLPKVVWELLMRNLWKEKGRNSTESLYDWAASKVGPTIFYYTGLGPYIEKLYGIPPKEVSSDWGKQRLKSLINFNLWKSIARDLKPAKKRQRANTRYCPEGIGELAEALHRYFVKNGGVIRLNAKVSGINVRRRSVENIIFHEGDRCHSVTGDYIISSVRLVDLIRMIEHRPPSEVMSAANLLRYRNLILLYLIINRPRILENCLLYMAERNATFKRITEFKYFTDKAAPEDKTSLCVEICCGADDDIWKETDEIIFQKIMREMEELNIVRPLDLEKYFVKRVTNTYPIYYLNYQETLEQIFDYLAGIRNLVSIGRQGLYQHDNMPTVIKQGFDVADRLKEADGSKLHEVSTITYENRLRKYAGVE